MMRSRSLARVVIAGLGVSLVITAGCGPFPPGPSPVPGNTPTPTVTVDFGGRLVNAETEGPVADVRVTVTAVASRGGGLRSAQSTPEEIATSAADGRFTLRLFDVPSDWTMLGLHFTAPPGYDDTHGRLEPTAAPCGIAPCWAATDRPEIRMYPTLVIRPGESIEVSVDARISPVSLCYPSRRVVVAASPGESVDLELVSHDSSKPMALSLEVPTPFCEPDMSVRRLIVPPGGVPFVFSEYSTGTATLTARR